MKKVRVFAKLMPEDKKQALSKPNVFVFCETTTGVAQFRTESKVCLLYTSSTARDATDQFSSTLYQAVMTDFILEGHFARHIRRMRILYMERRTALVEAVRKQMGDKLEVIGAEAGMHLVALLSPGVSDVEVSKKAAELGISAMPLSTCYLTPPARGGLDVYKRQR